MRGYGIGLRGLSLRSRYEGVGGDVRGREGGEGVRGETTCPISLYLADAIVYQRWVV